MWWCPRLTPMYAGVCAAPAVPVVNAMLHHVSPVTHRLPAVAAACAARGAASSASAASSSAAVASGRACRERTRQPQPQTERYNQHPLATRRRTHRLRPRRGGTIVARHVVRGARGPRASAVGVVPRRGALGRQTAGRCRRADRRRSTAQLPRAPRAAELRDTEPRAGDDGWRAPPAASYDLRARAAANGVIGTRDSTGRGGGKMSTHTPGRPERCSCGVRAERRSVRGRRRAGARRRTQGERSNRACGRRRGVTCGVAMKAAVAAGSAGAQSATASRVRRVMSAC